MERTAHITGLNRQTRLLWLPLPYGVTTVAFTVYPFFWFQWMPWLLSIVIWWCLAYIVTRINPQAHRVVFTLIANSHRWLFALFTRKSGMKYVC